jgi:very-short-patch-repair endonuclease
MLGNIVFIFFTVVLPIFALIYFTRYIQPNLPEKTYDHELLKCESPIERRLYNALKNNGHIVRSQERCGPYRIDLILPIYKLAIECDGIEFHSTPYQIKHDKKKNAYLRKHGWSVMRIKGKDINGKMPSVISRIEKRIKS